jgi:hypothetical protein
MVLLAGSIASAQKTNDSPPFARVNSFGVLSAFSGDSSHMFLGVAQNRRLLDIGVAYSRRLILGRVVNWQYDAELLPVALESDPVVHSVLNQQTPTVQTFVSDYRQWQACVPISRSYSDTLSNGIVYSGTIVTICNRTWTIGEAFSPFGFQFNFRPRNKVQPFIIGHGGYMYSTHPIPIDSAGSFNFTFDLGAGIEIYRSETKSICVDYRYHHISNHETANINPGIDSGVIQVRYTFGH